RAAEVPAAAGSLDRLVLLVNRITALLLLGQDEGWTEAAQMPTDALTNLQRPQVARGQGNIAEAASAGGRYADARQAVALAVSLTKDDHYPWLKCAAAAEELRLDWLMGAWGGLAERAELMSTDPEVPPVTQLRARLVGTFLEASTGSRAR